MSRSARWPEVVATRSGSVRGAPDGHGTLAWRGIPFARPPLGDLRWKSPRDPEPWDDVRDALEFASAPSQAGVRGSSEDSLYLNVWRPADGRTGLPVYVWLPGGGNQRQVPPLSATAGAFLSSRSDVVVVTVTYRVGDIGWFSHPALRQDADELDGSGNFGTLDIVKALQWVQANAEAFGGDPGNVLTTGESAGAFNTLTLLISPIAEGLYHRGMAQSGRQNTVPVEQADERSEAILMRLLATEHGSDEGAVKARRRMTHVEVAAFLRSRSPDQITEATRGIPFLAAFRDGTVLHERGFDALDDGSYPNKVPMIVGMNQEESKFQLARNRELQEDRELYQAVAKAGSDHKRATGCDAVLRRLRSNADQPAVYGYLFQYGWDGAGHPNPLPEPMSWITGAAHGRDIAFFLHGARGVRPQQGFTEQNQAGREALAEAMMGYVRSFAHSGEPRRPDPGLPEWEPWSNDPDGAKLIVFDADHTRALVHMGREELTLDEVQSRVQAMPERVRETAGRRIPTFRA